MDIEAKGELVGVEKEEGHKEDCIHKSLSLGGTEKKGEICEVRVKERGR
jgi:hypothetical protein